ncbi:MAG TPA: GvpL/GvpF family gas vesicle protein [Kribbella sp.]
MTDLGTYVYAVGRNLDDPGVSGISGAGDSTVRLISARGLTAVVSSVDLAEFGEAALRRNLEDLTWVERTARRHDEVVRQSAAAAGALAPFRLVTIYRSDDVVRDRIDEMYDELTLALDRIERRSEWSVKAFSKDDAPPAEVAATGAPESGAAYLQRRRAEIRRRNDATDSQRMRADQLFWDLTAAASATRRLAPQDRRLSGREQPMVLNGSFLIDDDRTGEFLDLVDRLRDSYPGLDVEVNGPWPAYSFAVLDAT